MSTPPLKFAGFQSPVRPTILRSPSSPFCTSPNELLEVTASDSEFNCFKYGMGMKSPGEGSRGRSVKEVEETHANLKKENFNLKLRIYFLEERMNTDFNINEENAVMKNIELKVELESLRKELAEKQEILCQAVKAMELEEEDYKKQLLEKENKFEELGKEYETLQHKYELIQDEVRSQGDVPPTDRDLYQHLNFEGEHSIELIKELEAKIADLENKLGEVQYTNAQLSNELQLADIRLASSENNTAFEEELRARDLRITCLLSEVEEKSAILADQRRRIVAQEAEVQEHGVALERMRHERSRYATKLEECEYQMKHMEQSMVDREAEVALERKRLEKQKCSVNERNHHIIALEDMVIKQKAHLETLESQVIAGRKSVPAASAAAEAVNADNAVLAKLGAAPHALNGTPPAASSSSGSSYRGSGRSAATSPAAQQTPSSKSSSATSSHSNSNSTSPHSSFVVCPETETDPEVLKQNLEKTRIHIVKLEKERTRACEIIKNMLDKRKEQGHEMVKLKETLLEKDHQITELKEAMHKLAEGSHRRKSLQAAIIEQNVTAAISGSDVNPSANNDIETSMTGEETDIKTLLAKYQTLVDDLDTQKEILQATIKELNSQMEKLRLDYNIALSDAKVKEEKISELECKVNLHKNSEKLDVGSEKEKSASFWIVESEEKDREIDRLEHELKKRTTDLQGLVNKELWEKNREIEKIQQRTVQMIEGKDEEIQALKSDNRIKDDQLYTLKNRISELGFHDSSLKVETVDYPDKTIQQKLRESIDDRKKLLEQIEILHSDEDITLDTHKDYQHLMNEFKQLKDEFDKSERLRQQTNEICSVLSTRLDELAFFLDSLLKQKSVLGFIGSKQNSKLRQIIDQSLDLSRTLNMNLSMNPDQSLLQLTNLSNFFNATCSEINAEDENTSSDNYEQNKDNEGIINEQTRIIDVLRNQIETMKKEIDLRDVELGRKLNNESVISYDDGVNINKMDAKPKRAMSPLMILENLMSEKMNVIIPNDRSLLNTTSTTLKYCENQSESESWSEPDRLVSKQRMGLYESLSLRKTPNESTDTTEDENQHSLTKTSSKRTLLAENKQIIAHLQQQVLGLEEKLNDKNELLLQTEQSFCAVSEQLKRELQIVDTLRTENDNLVVRIKEYETQLMMAEQAKNSAEIQMNDMQFLIDDLRKQQDILKDTMECKDKDTSNKLNLIEKEKLQAMDRAIIAEDDARKIKHVIEDYEVNLKELYKEKMHLEAALRHESEIIQRQAEEFDHRTKQLQTHLESEVQRITDTALSMKQKYETEYVKRAELDKMMSSIKELESLQMVLNTTEEKIQILEDNEAKLKCTLQETHQEYREKLVELRRELDHSTLRFSEIMLEKTRQLKEKASLELQIKEYACKEEDFKRQVSEFQQSLNSMKEMFQVQVGNLQSQKSALQLKLTEVQVVNDELRTRISTRVDQQKSNEASVFTATVPIKLSTSAPTTPNKFLSIFMGRHNSYSEPHRPFASPDQPLINRHHVVADEEEEDDDDDDEDEALVDRANGNSSPDLGIESDQGRFSSLEAGTVARPFLPTLELSQQMHSMMLDDSKGAERAADVSSTGDNVCDNDRCRDITNENSQLRQKLLKTRSALEETVNQLKSANERKKHVEKTICKQIHKTSQVLRKAKANLDSGSETEMRK